MRLNSIDIHNFKGIDELHLSFKPGFNLIVGENGKGKTSILEAIAVGLGGYVAGVPKTQTRHFSQDEIRTIYHRIGDGSCAPETFLPLEVELDATINEIPFHWKRSRVSEKESRSTIQPRDVYHYATRLTNEIDSELPLILFESAARLYNQKRAAKRQGITRFPRNVGYSDALKDASNQKMIIDWCVKMEMLWLHTKNEIEEYESVKRIVSDFMTEMNRYEGDSKCRVYFDVQLWEIMYEMNGAVMPLSSLSAGYQSLIWMVFDIAYRMAILNPHLGRNICLTKGIVLIDELDMHLHPKWQWSVINALATVFPNIQFIATTHAPVLAVSSKNVNIINIEGLSVIGRVSNYGADVNTAIEDYLNSTSYPPEIKEAIDSVVRFFDNNELQEAENTIQTIKERLGGNHPLVVRLMARLTLEQINWEG